MTITFYAPTKPWSINEERSKHWSWRHTRAAAWRTAAWAAAQQAGAGPQPPSIIKVTLPFDRGARRDPHNYIGPVKALVDGLVDAGLWEDDAPKFVMLWEPELVVDRDGLVTVTVEPRPNYEDLSSGHRLTLALDMHLTEQLGRWEQAHKDVAQAIGLTEDESEQ